MAKFVLVCMRGGVEPPAARIARACSRIVPDHLEPTPPLVVSRPGLTLAVVGPPADLPVHDASLCLGRLLGPSDRWWIPGSPVPDGSFALVRADADRVELATDAVASRSVFFAATDGVFVASTSQRAIVAVLGGFRLDPGAVSWMISSGSLGPGGSWDARVRRMGADERVVLDRARWKVTSHRRPIVFEPSDRREEEHAERLRAAVLSTVDAVDVSGGGWRLPLSGGYDSRLLLLRLSRRQPIPCITWGTPAALEDEGSDAHVARRLAGHAGVAHAYYPLDGAAQPVETILERFLVNGEGCVDHLSGYLDGFDLWRRLHADAVRGVVRGDEGFGWAPASTETDARRVAGATMLTDLYGARRLDALGLAEQRWPADLARTSGESIATWRDRLYHAFRIPVILASLSDLKASYVEIVNPFLARPVLEIVRTLPDALRTEKRLFRRLVDSLGPPIPYAARPAIPAVETFVLGAPFLRLARREVLAAREEGSLPAPFVAHLLAAIPEPPPERGDDAGASREARAPAPPGPASRVRASLVRVARKLPPRVRSAIKVALPQPPPPGTLALRAVLVGRMARTLRADAAEA